MTDTHKSPDGAHHGLKPSSALRSALGGAALNSAPPLSPAEMATYLESAPEKPQSYDDAACYVGGVMLRYFRDHPEALALDAFTAFEGAMPVTPGTPIEGVTGFMVGWGVNAARYALTAPPIDNPAILDL